MNNGISSQEAEALSPEASQRDLSVSEPKIPRPQKPPSIREDLNYGTGDKAGAKCWPKTIGTDKNGQEDHLQTPQYN